MLLPLLLFLCIMLAYTMQDQLITYLPEPIRNEIHRAESHRRLIKEMDARAQIWREEESKAWRDSKTWRELQEEASKGRGRRYFD